jgi:hypothetical protein
VSNAISSAPNSGGTLSIGSGVTLAAPITLGAGDITLNGGGASVDVIITSDLTIAGNTTISASRDIIVRAHLTTTSGNLSLVAAAGAGNTGGTGAGGVWVDATLGNTGQVTSAGSLTITGKDLFASTDFNTDAVRLQGPISAGGTIALDNTTTGGAANSGAGAYLGSTATTSAGDVVANQPVTLLGDSTITNNGSGNIIFFSTVNSAPTTHDALTVNGNGATTFTGAVGTSQALSSLTASGATISLHNVTTTGLQSYTGATSVNDNDTLTTSGGAVTFTGAVTVGTLTSISLLDVVITIDTTNNGATPSGNNISFSSTINGAHSNDDLVLKAGTGGDISVTGIVGGVQPLKQLTVNSAHNVTFSSAIHTTDNVAQVSGTGTTTFNGGSIGGTLNVTTDTISIKTANLAVTSTITLDAAHTIS